MKNPIECLRKNRKEGEQNLGMGKVLADFLPRHFGHRLSNEEGVVWREGMVYGQRARMAEIIGYDPCGYRFYGSCIEVPNNLGEPGMEVPLLREVQLYSERDGRRLEAWWRGGGNFVELITGTGELTSLRVNANAVEGRKGKFKFDFFKEARRLGKPREKDFKVARDMLIDFLGGMDEVGNLGEERWPEIPDEVFLLSRGWSENGRGKNE